MVSSLMTDPIIQHTTNLKDPNKQSIRTQGRHDVLSLVWAKVHSRILLSSFLFFIVRSLHPSRSVKVFVPLSRNQKHHSKLLTRLCWGLSFAHLSNHRWRRLGWALAAKPWNGFATAPWNGIHQTPWKWDWLTQHRAYTHTTSRPETFHQPHYILIHKSVEISAVSSLNARGPRFLNRSCVRDQKTSPSIPN